MIFCPALTLGAGGHWGLSTLGPIPMLLKFGGLSYTPMIQGYNLIGNCYLGDGLLVLQKKECQGFQCFRHTLIDNTHTLINNT